MRGRYKNAIYSACSRCLPGRSKKKTVLRGRRFVDATYNSHQRLERWNWRFLWQRQQLELIEHIPRALQQAHGFLRALALVVMLDQDQDQDAHEDEYEDENQMYNVLLSLPELD